MSKTEVIPMTMMESVEQKLPFHINWYCVQQAVIRVGFAAFFFALGGWVVSVRVHEGSLPYRDRATNQLEAIQRTIGKDPIAVTKCLRRKSAAAEDAAIQSEVSKFVPAVHAPNLADIPDCPPAPIAHLAEAKK